MTHYILNCVRSVGTETDWSFNKSLDTGLPIDKALKSIDLRQGWWSIKDQGSTGACVGYATADGVLKWIFVKNGLMEKQQDLSVRFVWMANKEMDELVEFPTTFLEKAGTQTKLAMHIVYKYGCVLEQFLPMNGALSDLDVTTFYSVAKKFRIKSYHNLGMDLDHWRRWISHRGPILARVAVDKGWLNIRTSGVLDHYTVGIDNSGHAVSVVGYSNNHFIIRNSWGVGWGDNGYAYVSTQYVEQAFSDVYGALL